MISDPGSAFAAHAAKRLLPFLEIIPLYGGATWDQLGTSALVESRKGVTPPIQVIRTNRGRFCGTGRVFFGQVADPDEKHTKKSCGVYVITPISDYRSHFRIQ